MEFGHLHNQTCSQTTTKSKTENRVDDHKMKINNFLN